MNSVRPITISASRRCSVSTKERNLLSAFSSILIIALLVTALTQSRWYYLKGGGCHYKYLGAQQFFSIGSFNAVRHTSVNGSTSSLAYYYLNEEMKNCVTPKIINIQRVIIGLCSLAMFSTLFQLYMDITGITRGWFKHVRRNGAGSILSVFLIVVVIILCYYSSELMAAQQEMTKLYPATKVEISFGMSYYLITAAGALSIIAAAANLFRRYSLSSAQDVSLLLDDSQAEAFSIGLPHSRSWLHFRERNNYLPDFPPPPPYTP